MTRKRGTLNFSKRIQARTTLEPERRRVKVVERASRGRALIGHHGSAAVHLRSETEPNQGERRVSHIHPHEIGQDGR